MPVAPAAVTPAPVAPVPVVPAPVAVPAAPAAPVATDEVTEAVVGIVSELTGYPPDLLDLDLDLEADLGVDTVKQAEVFAAVRQRFDVARDDELRLRDFPTLTHVIGWIRERMAGPATAETPAEAARAEPAPTGRITRRVPVPALRPALAACVPTGVTLEAGVRVVVMPDSGGVADALATRLQRLGAEVRTLDPDDPVADLAGFAAEGPVHGVYWLAALDDEGPLAELGPESWSSAVRRRVHSLHATMRALGEHNPFLITATRLGGFHGYDDAGATCPLGGAVTGFAKAYRRERPATLVKAVDFAPSRKTAALADLLVEETLRDPGCVEAGHADGRRWGVGLADRPFGAPIADLGPGQVFVVTGAAGSIVSAITADLAAASRGTFHLIDLTPEPDPADPALRRYTEDREAFKREYADRLRAAGERPTPVAIERELARLERSQAALAAIEAVQRAGGSVHYHCADLTDPGAVEKALAPVLDGGGRVDVLLHGAGLEISHALPDKSPAEFGLVFGVKADGLYHVLHALREVPLGAVVAFSSVAGRFGNAGQTDYSAANDLLCKTSSSFRRTRPDTRAIALDWTAWGGIGMATRGSIPKVMEMAGIDMLPPEAGIAWIRRELTAGNFRGEVVVGGALGVLGAVWHETGGLDLAATDHAANGLLVGDITSYGVYGGLTAEVTLDPAAQPFLDHHRIGGTAVLPGVMGVETFAEVARAAVPDLEVIDIEDVQFIAPV
jgi:NAD(P)-dependent dehydrogenase (short-subunit alcohol dehydrogenase family)